VELAKGNLVFTQLTSMTQLMRATLIIDK
jgi:hypothetical protein